MFLFHPRVDRYTKISPQKPRTAAKRSAVIESTFKLFQYKSVKCIREQNSQGIDLSSLRPNFL